MAVTKIKHLSNLPGSYKKAIDYILNPDKSDNGILVTSSNCSAEHAAHEFLLTQHKYYPNEKFSQSVRCAIHLIQSFSPDDPVTPETAHEISAKLATSIFGNDYQYLVSTHIDKGHIHSHIIANSYALNEKKKFHMDKDFYKDELRKKSDELCQEYGLSTIEPKSKGKEFKEYSETKKGNSWKEKLKISIDEAIKNSNSYEKFLLKIQEMEIEIKHGKHIAFRPKNKERFVRGKTIGEDYSEAGIKQRISNKKEISEKNSNTQINLKNICKIEKYIDFENNEKTKNKGYANWANRFNLTQSIYVLNYLKTNNINSISALAEKKNDEEAKLLNVEESINSNNEIIKTYEKILDSMKFCLNHQETIKTFKRLSGSYKEKFYNENKNQIDLYDTNQAYLKTYFGEKKFLTFKEIYQKINAVKAENKVLYGERKKQKEVLKELKNVLSNLDEIFKPEDTEKNFLSKKIGFIR